MTYEARCRIRARYLRDATPTRLGGIAANLARVDSFSRHEEGRAAVESLLEESKHFIDWAGPELDIEMAVELAGLQRQIVQWHRHLDEVWTDPTQRRKLSDSARAWSDRVLHLSGLLAPHPAPSH